MRVSCPTAPWPASTTFPYPPLIKPFLPPINTPCPMLSMHSLLINHSPLQPPLLRQTPPPNPNHQRHHAQPAMGSLPQSPSPLLAAMKHLLSIATATMPNLVDAQLLTKLSVPYPFPLMSNTCSQPPDSPCPILLMHSSFACLSWPCSSNAFSSKKKEMLPADS